MNRKQYLVWEYKSVRAHILYGLGKIKEAKDAFEDAKQD